MKLIVVTHQYQYRDAYPGADTVWGVYSDIEHAASAVERAEQLEPGHIDRRALYQFDTFTTDSDIITGTRWTFGTCTLDDDN